MSGASSGETTKRSDAGHRAAALGEGAGIGILRFRPKQPRLLPVMGHAVAAQIVEMRLERRDWSGDHSAPDHGQRVRDVMRRLA